MSPRKRNHSPAVVGLSMLLVSLVAVACVAVNPPLASSSSPSPLVSVALDTPVPTPTVASTRRPCVAGDTRPRCQTAAPPTTAPTDSPSPTPSATPTESPSPTPTESPTPTPHANPTGSTGGVDTQVAIDTLEIDFGTVAVSGTGGPISVTITNTGSDPFGPINIFGGAPSSPAFNASQNCQGTTLPAGGSCAVNYTFSPPAAGYYSDFSDFTISETSSQADGEDFNVAIYGCGDHC